MAIRTRQPEVLRELFAALGNDPFMVAECLARPILSERLVEQLHDESPAETESLISLAAKLETESSVPTEQLASGYYLPEIANSPAEDRAGGCVDNWAATSTIGAPDQRASHTAVWTGTEIIIWGRFDSSNAFNIGGRYAS